MGDPLVVYSCAPEPVSGLLLERRKLAARPMLWHPPLLWRPLTLTMRALEAFDAGVLWTLLHALDYLPEPAEPEARDEEMEAERDRLYKARASAATYLPGAADLIAMTEQSFAEARERLVRFPRKHRGNRRKESARRRRDVLRVLEAGLAGWALADIARLVLESSAWIRPPCPKLADENAGCPEALADLFAHDRRR